MRTALCSSCCLPSGAQLLPAGLRRPASLSHLGGCEPQLPASGAHEGREAGQTAPLPPAAPPWGGPAPRAARIPVGSEPWGSSGPGRVVSGFESPFRFPRVPHPFAGTPLSLLSWDLDEQNHSPGAVLWGAEGGGLGPLGQFLSQMAPWLA